ncbi:MAG: aldo/keto reductase, partial [bacterium]
IRWEVTRSLERLRVETLDLVQIHHPDRQVPIAESIGTLLDLQHEGKLRHIGVSNFSADQIRKAQAELGDIPLCSAQPEYSLVRRDAESQIIPTCRELNIGVIVYSPLAAGLLTGRKMPPDPSLQKIRQAVEDVLRPIARNHNVSEASVGLSWVIAQQGITAAISGASNVKQLDEQAHAFHLELSESELAQLTSAFFDAQLPYSWERSGSGLSRVIRRVRRLLGRAARKLGVDPSILRRRN